MAHGTAVLNEIEEAFCQCPICLEQYKDPKQLPCLHRYCSKCLHQLLQKSDRIIKCPECRKEFPVPTEGVEGFSSDFYMQNLIEYIELNKSLEKKDTLQICYGCSKETKISAYCDKCNTFLCKDCHNYHASSNLFRDHKAHLININSDTNTQTILTKKLESQKESPRCPIHRENDTQLCCSTCNNMLICITCTYGEHKNHDINDVITFANAERMRLEEDMGPLYKARENLDQVFTNLAEIKKDISSFVTEKSSNLQLEYEKELAEIEVKSRLLKRQGELDEINLKDKLELSCNNLKQKMQEELQKIRDKFENLLTKEKKEAKGKLNNIQQKVLAEDFVLVENSNLLGKRFQEAIMSLEKEKNRRVEEMEKILQHYDGTKKRFENLVATASGILQSQCNWTAAQCIPEIRTAVQPLILDLNKRFPDVNKLSHFNVNLTLQPQVDQILLPDVRGNSWNMNCITSTTNGSIVTSGSASGTSTHITVIDVEGNTIRQKEFSGTKSRTSTWRFCCPMQSSKVATVCWPSEIGIFDTQDSSYFSKNIREITNKWPDYQVVGSVAQDKTRKRIVVIGHKSNIVYVFDYQLKYCRNFTLPRFVHWPRDITVSGGNLIVCDLAGQSTFVINMKGNLVFSFCEMHYAGIPWKPYNVCTDRNDFVWMLFTSGKGDSILVKYNNNGKVFRVVQRLDVSAECLTAYETTEASLILVASYEKGIIFKFENKP